MTLEAGTPIGRYVVRRKLAEGGMAEIYLASARGAEGFAKDVVIKRIRAFLATDPAFVEMFIAEASLASRLDHANIVQIFDFDKHGDSFYIAMELVRGKSLWDLRRKCREQMVPMPPAIVAQIGSEVARGLHYAHRKTDRGNPLGVVHRDVTPHNVLLSWEGAVKLTDFGIAKAGNKLTSPGMLKGKFAYMAPEQARGEEVDARTDVFALGIVLWEMLTGGRLFEGDSDVAVLRAVQHSNIAPPGRLNPDVHPDLDAVVMRALERDVAQRFQSAQELERALGQFILKHAQTIDDTDVGAFLRRVFAEELAGDGVDRTGVGLSPLPPSEPAKKREPTAVMPGSASRPAAPAVDPDEDVNASTFVVKKDGAAPARPTEKLPSLGGSGGGDLRERTTSRERPAPMPAEEKAPPVVAPVVAPVATPQPAPAAEPLPQSVSVSVPSFVPPPRKQPSPPRRSASRALVSGVAVVALLAIAGTVAFVTREQPQLEADAGVPTVVVTVPDAGTPVVDAGAPEPDAGPEPPPDAGGPPVVVPPTETDAGVRPPPTVSMGKLVLTASPWANVFIDGESRGDVAGSRELELPPGKYVVKFVHPRRKTEKVVTIRANRTQRVHFDVFGSK